MDGGELGGNSGVYPDARDQGGVDVATNPPDPRAAAPALSLGRRFAAVVTAPLTGSPSLLLCPAPPLSCDRL